jgi:glycosyltransferase involved in cell wall biosynthesis
MRNINSRSAKAVVVTAVLPSYREDFLLALHGSSDDIAFYAGATQQDASVVTGVSQSLYTKVKTKFFFGRRVFWQSSVLATGMGASTLVVDLNPRSLSAWFFLIVRRCLRRRVLVWGHIDPRRGASSSTAPLRRIMRRLASGVITYTWTDRRRVMDEDKTEFVWVAPNALYRREQLEYARDSAGRNNIIYVGRLVPEKKPELLLEAFAQIAQRLPLASLLFVGDGASGDILKNACKSLDISDRVELLGSVTAVADLRKLYDSAAVSISPGYVGLSLTQSLGFGVPMIYADDEAHSPEIELVATGAVMSFTSDSVQSLSHAIVDIFDHQEEWRARACRASIEVADLYSADSMAAGFRSAVAGEPLKTPAVAWLE